ncbi:E domain-containing protein, partial [Staphylococcus canis]
GEEKVVQEGEPGEQTTTTPIFVNPITGEKVSEGEPTTEVTKDPINKIIEFGGEEIPQGHKDEFDPNIPVGETEEVPGRPGIKNPETGEIVTPPVDDITKHGPKEGNPEVTKEEIPFEVERQFNPDLAPGEEKVVQEGEPGEQTTTTPIFVNPITGEKVSEGEPTTEVTKDPINKIIEFGGELIPQGHRDEFDPNLPPGTKEEVPGRPGIKNPETGEIVTPPVDDITKHGPNKDVPMPPKEDQPAPPKEDTPKDKPGEDKPMPPKEDTPKDKPGEDKPMPPKENPDGKVKEPSVEKPSDRIKGDDNQPEKPGMKADQEKGKALPETGGEDAHNATIFGALMTLLGSVVLFNRRKNKKDQS